MEMADRLVSDGFKDVGYEYVNIDVSDSSLLLQVQVYSQQSLDLSIIVHPLILNMDLLSISGSSELIYDA